MPDSASTPRPRRSAIIPAFDPVAQPWRQADEGLSAVDAGLLTPASLRRILSEPPDWMPEPSFEESLRHPGREGTPVQAAVLIPMVMHPSGVSVMLT